MRDMKTSFSLATTLAGLDWSFMLEIFEETVGEGDGAVAVAVKREKWSGAPR